jgi:hypothetical protein
VHFRRPDGDLAVLTTPDNQELFEQAEAYDALVDATTPLRIGQRACMLGRDASRLISGKPEVWGDGSLWVIATDGYVQGGMSGSPIVTSEGAVIRDRAAQPGKSTPKPGRTRCLRHACRPG